ncbi:MAG: hypothetical protein HYW01_06545 [Deltaproteobacteria bacterium]|nr:hypothetical protein [Deltaproteobacteria bacterium]
MTGKKSQSSTVFIVIPNPVPNECEGACEESCWFQDDRRNSRMTVT